MRTGDIALLYKHDASVPTRYPLNWLTDRQRSLSD